MSDIRSPQEESYFLFENEDIEDELSSYPDDYFTGNDLDDWGDLDDNDYCCWDPRSNMETGYCACKAMEEASAKASKWHYKLRHKFLFIWNSVKWKFKKSAWRVGIDIKQDDLPF